MFCSESTNFPFHHFFLKFPRQGMANKPDLHKQFSQKAHKWFTLPFTWHVTTLGLECSSLSPSLFPRFLSESIYDRPFVPFSLLKSNYFINILLYLNTYNNQTFTTFGMFSREVMMNTEIWEKLRFCLQLQFLIFPNALIVICSVFLFCLEFLLFCCVLLDLTLFLFFFPTLM